ncbi:hypothetical protein, partial [Brucella melitensis]|uniref:hypothetical protein n=1 Tax=Brucella melitensis TaxID=29459 RepID=UPI001AEE2077
MVVVFGLVLFGWWVWVVVVWVCVVFGGVVFGVEVGLLLVVGLGGGVRRFGVLLGCVVLLGGCVMGRVLDT